MIRLGFCLATSAPLLQFSCTRLHQKSGYLQNWISDSAKAESPALDLMSMCMQSPILAVFHFIKKKFFFFAPLNLRCSTGASLVVAQRLSCPVARGILVLQWCYPTMSSSVSHFSNCLQSFPASGSFPMSQLLASGGQSIGASASAPVLPMSIQGWFPLRLTGLISLLSKRLSRVFSSNTVLKHQFFSALPSLWSSFHIHT